MWMGFQDNPVRALLECGEAFHDLIRSRAPRARAVEHAPLLLPPAALGVKLLTGDMQRAALDQWCAIRFRKMKPDGVGINDLQARSRLEVEKLAQHVRLLQASICLPIELHDRGVEVFAVVEFHAL